MSVCITTQWIQLEIRKESIGFNLFYVCDNSILGFIASTSGNKSRRVSHCYGLLDNPFKVGQRHYNTHSNDYFFLLW